MKITETIQRDCCHEKDMKSLAGSPKYRGLAPEYRFCVHCGRHWEAVGFTDAAGSSDWEYRPMLRPWENR